MSAAKLIRMFSDVASVFLVIHVLGLCLYLQESSQGVSAILLVSYIAPSDCSCCKTQQAAECRNSVLRTADVSEVWWGGETRGLQEGRGRFPTPWRKR